MKVITKIMHRSFHLPLSDVTVENVQLYLVIKQILLLGDGTF